MSLRDLECLKPGWLPLARASFRKTKQTSNGKVCEACAVAERKHLRTR
jgi:hypothetical protein